MRTDKQEIDLLRKALAVVRDNLGVPGPGTPYPVAYAYWAAQDALNGHWGLRPRRPEREQSQRQEQHAQEWKEKHA
jgi:hypothetical protein